MPGNHTRLAPSAAKRWTLCPGSVALVASLPADQQDQPNQYSTRGTMCHEVLADCLEHGQTPGSFVGKEFDIEGFPHTFTNEDAGNVQVAVSYARQRHHEYGARAQFLIEEPVDPGANFHAYNGDASTPEFLRVPTPAPRTDCKGTSDVVFIGNGYLEVIDYKNGRGLVEANDPQLILYALGAMKQARREDGVQCIRLTVVQPNAATPSINAVRTHEMTPDEMMSQAVYFGQAAAAADDPNAPRVPGEDQCRWCPAKALCPEHAATMATAVQGTLPEVITAPAGEPGGLSGETLTAPPPATPGPSLVDALAVTPDTLSLEQLATILDAEEMIRGWLKAVHEHALKAAMSGEKVPGYKLVSGRRSRSWDEKDDEMIARFGKWNRIGDDGKAAGKLRREHYTKVSLISPAQAEANIKPMVTAATWKSIEKHISTAEGKPTLAPETDSRRAIIMTTSAEAFGITEQAEVVDNDTSTGPDLSFLD